MLGISFFYFLFYINSLCWRKAENFNQFLFYYLKCFINAFIKKYFLKIFASFFNISSIKSLSKSYL